MRAGLVLPEREAPRERGAGLNLTTYKVYKIKLYVYKVYKVYKVYDLQGLQSLHMYPMS